MLKIYWVGVLALVGVACSAPKPQPNVLILLADDLGYADLGSYGGVAATPHLDALAGEGTTFTNCYSGAPNCSPARVSLLTGKMPFRSGMYSYRPPHHVMHLPDEEVTMAEVFELAGYQTAHFGKWHLSCLPQDTTLMQPQPDEQGFHYSIGTENNSEPSHFNPVNFVKNGEPMGTLQGYSSHLLVDQIEEWFDRIYQPEQPFMMYVPFHEPHAKVVSPPELEAHYADFDPKSAAYFASIENMDLAIGRLLALLKQKGLYDNTIVFFASDNGSYRYESNGNLRGKKGEVYDGGIKVPAILRLPAANAGKKTTLRRVTEPVWFPDLLPTLARFSALEVPGFSELDGVDISPLVEGKPIVREKHMMWFFYRSSPELAVRMGQYSLLAKTYDTLPRTHYMTDQDMAFIENMKPVTYELFDLDSDPGQQRDIAREKPVVLQEMIDKSQAYFRQAKSKARKWEGLPVYNPSRAFHNKEEEYQANKKRFAR